MDISYTQHQLLPHPVLGDTLLFPNDFPYWHFQKSAKLCVEVVKVDSNGRKNVVQLVDPNPCDYHHGVNVSWARTRNNWSITARGCEITSVRIYDCTILPVNEIEGWKAKLNIFENELQVLKKKLVEIDARPDMGSFRFAKEHFETSVREHDKLKDVANRMFSL